jgi:tRNA-2-methylthio-N6-dimethylallyladenosine synthase
MNRNYNIKHYKNLVNKIRNRINDVCLSTDIISGFPTETDEDHRNTLDLMNEIRFDGAFMFKYSPRENTAAHAMKDNIEDEIKGERINQIIKFQNTISREINEKLIGITVRVLAEGVSKKSDRQWHGRTDGNKMVVFDKGTCSEGEYIQTKITHVNSATLFGSPAVPSHDKNGGDIV